MKKSAKIVLITAFCALALASLFALSACECQHEWNEWTTTKEATCETEGEKTRSCGKCGESEKEALPALGHEETTDDVVEATCTKTGLTAGKHCSRCKKALIKQEEIPALGHEEVIDVAAVEAACTTAGKTAAMHCDRCGEILSVQEDVPALGHEEVVDVEAVEATCTVAGKTAKTHCAAAEKYSRIRKKCRHSDIKIKTENV